MEKFYLTRYPSDETAAPILEPRVDMDWEAKAVFNPSVVNDDGIFHMLYRAFPRALTEDEPRLHRPGHTFKHQISYIGYASSADGIHFDRRAKPFISPSEPYDRFGCEDPRITKLGDTFYVTYTAIDAPLDERHGSHPSHPNIRIALASTKDFTTVTKHGIIGPKIQSKAAAFFSQPIVDGKLGMLLTVNSDTANSTVCARLYNSIGEVLAASEEAWAVFLAAPYEVLKTAWWLKRGPELGAPPILTERGWLLIYSTESMADIWTVSAALLDRDDPTKLIARTPGNILQPATQYEREGLVPNVTFPSGAIVVNDKLYAYYGCADTRIGLATCTLNELLDYVESFRDKH